MRKLKSVLLGTLAICTGLEASTLERTNNHNGAFIGIGGVGVLNKLSATQKKTIGDTTTSKKGSSSKTFAGGTVYAGYGALAGGMYLGFDVNGTYAKFSKNGIKKTTSIGADLLLGAPFSPAFVGGLMAGIETAEFKYTDISKKDRKYAPRVGIFGKAHISQNVDLDLQLTGSFYSSNKSATVKEGTNDVKYRVRTNFNDYRLMIGLSFKFGK